MRIKGAFVTTAVVLLGISGVFAAFIGGASPYVTVKEAKTATGDGLHLAGDILKETVQNNVAQRTLRFRLKDANGDVVQVVHTGTPPANMGEATRVVAVGKMQGDEFHSEQLLVKCPSKYEGQESGQKVARRS